MHLSSSPYEISSFFFVPTSTFFFFWGWGGVGSRKENYTMQIDSQLESEVEPRFCSFTLELG